ncbi:MAG: DUF429 domain-containing protein [Candidatus Altiarchaeales archaeon]|nr:DUF429 domain-containing protein [Candidatus Altiarchaeales archaeon]MBD3415756.1 DUF429 domain-containing protein [Candidatus Altiarchaeales archaeon]
MRLHGVHPKGRRGRKIGALNCIHSQCFPMRVVGLDLAGSPKNSTGFCILEVEGGKTVHTRLIHSDEEILSDVTSADPDLVAVDAPLIYEGVRRNCDDLLREYGALPVTLKGMEVLAERGRKIASDLKRLGLDYIEVFPTASAKILGVYSKNDFTLQKNMMALDLKGDLNTKILSRDELDAVLASLTGFLYLQGQSEPVGDENGLVHIPLV